MSKPIHPGRFLKRELAVRDLSANRLSLDLGVPSGRRMQREFMNLSARIKQRISNEYFNA